MKKTKRLMIEITPELEKLVQDHCAVCEKALPGILVADCLKVLPDLQTRRLLAKRDILSKMIVLRLSREIHMVRKCGKVVKS